MCRICHLRQHDPGVNMTSRVSISEAAERAGVSRVTMHRALKAGTISKETGDDGKPFVYLSELARVFPKADVSDTFTRGKKSAQLSLNVTEVPSMTHGLTGSGGGDPVALQAEIAALKAENTLLREALDDAKAQRDRAQAEMTAQRELFAALTPRLTDQRPRKSWFSRG